MSSLYIRNRTQDTSDNDNWVLVKLGGGGGGGITASSTDFTNIGEGGSLITDTTSQSGEVITGSTSGLNDINVFSTDLEDVELGACSLIMRAWFSDVSSTADALSIEVQAVDSEGNATLLNTFKISPNMFTANETWECIGMGVNFNGTTESVMRIICTSLGSSSGIDYKIDYVKVLPAVTALGSIG